MLTTASKNIVLGHFNVNQTCNLTKLALAALMITRHGMMTSKTVMLSLDPALSASSQRLSATEFVGA
eukprot:3236325-Amphidinium_carterae.1